MIRRIVSEAPPLSPEQRRRLADILSPPILARDDYREAA